MKVINNQFRCSICDKTSATKPIAKARLSGPKVYDLLSCPHCGVAFFNPTPSKEELGYHYSAGYPFYKSDNFKAQGKGMVFANKYLKHKESGSFLDIGCASGDFLAGIKQASQWNVVGTDINPKIVASVKEKLDLDIRVGEIEDISFDEKSFDFIRIQDILEHVPSPITFLHECRRILKDDGTLYLSVPNGLADMQSLIDYYALHQKPAFSGAGHIYFFPFKTLETMFKATGFRIEKVYSYNFKKGLRSFSMLPKSKHWNRDLLPPSETLQTVSELEPYSQKKRSINYYKFQFFKDSIFQVPGIHKYGQDFMFILRPI